MNVRRIGGRGWIWLLASAILACAADPGDDPKSDAPGAVTRSPNDGSGGPSPFVDGGSPEPMTGVATADSSPNDGASSSETGAGSVDARASIDASSPADETGPSQGSSCPTCPLTVEYFTRDSSPMGQTIAFDLSISNNGSAPQPLSELTVRYWFTADGATAFSMHEYYAASPIAGNVTGTFRAATAATATADTILEVAFGAAAGAIAPMSSTRDIQLAFNDTAYKTTFNEQNDYSYASGDTMASCTSANNAVTCPSTKITLYRGGMLVWGIEPSGIGSAGDP